MDVPPQARSTTGAVCLQNGPLEQETMPIQAAALRLAPLPRRHGEYACGSGKVGKDLIRWPVSVGPEADIGDDPFTGGLATLYRGAAPMRHRAEAGDRTSVGSGKSVAVRVALGGRRNSQIKHHISHKKHR